jgi:hypothetical protein
MSASSPRVTSTHERRRGASRPTIVLGYASIGAVAAMIAGGFIGLFALGLEMPDGADGLPFPMMVGASVGWVAGATRGFRAGRNAKPAGRAGGMLLLLGGEIMVLGAVVILLLPTPWRLGGTVTYFSWRRYPSGPEFVAAMVAGTVLVLATFLLVWLPRAPAQSERRSGSVDWTGRVGVVVGVASFWFAMLSVQGQWSAAAARQRYEAASSTLSNLMTAAERQYDRSGSYPTSLEEVIAAGGRIRPGTTVEFAGVANDAFCARVGIDIGEENRTGPPQFAGLVHPHTPGSPGWIETWSGSNSCSHSRPRHPKARENNPCSPIHGIPRRWIAAVCER